MKKKIIGITTRYQTKDEQFLNSIKKYFSPEYQFIIIHNINEFDQLKEYCDGFIMQGGPDVNPELYHEEPLDAKEIDNSMDLLDKKVVIYSEMFNIPFMGICRGMQMLAAVLGGTLYQDIEKANLIHPVDENNMHPVNKLFNFRLTNRLPDTFNTNSIHHQSVNDIPYGFIPMLVSGNVIEGIIHQTKPLFGIQWHPELLDTTESTSIFNYFKELVDERNSNK